MPKKNIENLNLEQSMILLKTDVCTKIIGQADKLLHYM